ncbi:MAG TPA: hypothetical protein VGG51_12135 [Candidatus Cybelea sp.]
MRISSPARRLGLFVAGAMLAGCGALRPAQGDMQLPTAGSEAMRRTPAIAAHAGRRSWMAPDAKKHDLLYISNFYSSTVLVFTYPGGKLAGELTPITDPQGECTSKTSHGNWWVVASGADEIMEYAHGGTSPISTLSEDIGEPAYCAVDPTTGNLAVTILGAGDIVVFAYGSGSGTTISDGLTSSGGDAYDDRGDLFVDGLTPSNRFALLELPKGGRSFEAITLHPNILGTFQWHDNYLAVYGGGGIYHFAIHGMKGKEVGFTPLRGGSDLTEFCIQEGHVAAADAGNENAQMWKYPAGGPVLKTLQGSFDGPAGAAVSVAK